MLGAGADRDHAGIEHDLLARGDKWVRAHDVPEGHKPHYNGLSDKFALITGTVSIGESDALAEELRKRRKERGWPDPTSGTLDPGIEGAIMSLWLGGMRRHGRRND